MKKRIKQAVFWILLVIITCGPDRWTLFLKEEDNFDTSSSCKQQNTCDTISAHSSCARPWDAVKFWHVYIYTRSKTNTRRALTLVRTDTDSSEGRFVTCKHCRM